MLLSFKESIGLTIESMARHSADLLAAQMQDIHGRTRFATINHRLHADLPEEWGADIVPPIRLSGDTLNDFEDCLR